MGGRSSKLTTINSVDNLPRDIYKVYLTKAKHSINDQYDSNTSVIHFPSFARCTIHMDNSRNTYRILDGACTKFDGELAAYCKDLIKRPYVLVGRTVYLVENYQ
jgi:hypothetical protein